MNMIIIWLLFMNKILSAIKELFFTESNLHIFLIFIFVLQCTQIPIFSYLNHCLISCKNYDLVLMRKIMQKCELKFYIYAKFRAKNELFRMNAQFSCKTGFLVIRSWCEISDKKVISCNNKKTSCARESTVSWKHYNQNASTNQKY